jgi:hypothetical protein
LTATGWLLALVTSMLAPVGPEFCTMQETPLTIQPQSVDPFTDDRSPVGVTIGGGGNWSFRAGPVGALPEHPAANAASISVK